MSPPEKFCMVESKGAGVAEVLNAQVGKPAHATSSSMVPYPSGSPKEYGKPLVRLRYSVTHA
jgi:hypothetical protein